MYCYCYYIKANRKVERVERPWRGLSNLRLPGARGRSHHPVLYIKFIHSPTNYVATNFLTNYPCNKLITYCFSYWQLSISLLQQPGYIWRRKICHIPHSAIIFILIYFNIITILCSSCFNIQYLLDLFYKPNEAALCYDLLLFLFSFVTDSPKTFVEGEV